MPKESKPKRASIRIAKDPASGQLTVETVKNSSDWSPGDAITQAEIDKLVDDDGWDVTVKAGKAAK